MFHCIPCQCNSNGQLEFILKGGMAIFADSIFIFLEGEHIEEVFCNLTYQAGFVSM